MRWNFEEVFFAIRLNIFFRVDGKFLVGIDADQHLTDVGLQKKIFRLLVPELQQIRDIKN